MNTQLDDDDDDDDDEFVSNLDLYRSGTEWIKINELLEIIF